MRIDEVTAYHGTDSSITSFRPLTHFGSEKAAGDRIGYKKLKNGKVYQVELDINNPALIKDFSGVHAPTQFAFALKRAKIISEDEMLTVTTLAGQPEKQTPILVRLLKSKGYDAIAYKNRYEDRGHISYVILDPNQAKIIDIVEK
jgi:hypothetical protein